MNNEPVAWIDLYDLERLPHHDCWVNGQEHKNSVPLYTHPVKQPMMVLDGNRVYSVFKELTDEEILEYSDVFALDYSPLYEFTAKGLVLFARAILRKAQEK